MVVAVVLLVVEMVVLLMVVEMVVVLMVARFDSKELERVTQQDEKGKTTDAAGAGGGS